MAYDPGRQGNPYWRARKRVLVNATHCAICGGALDFDAPPRSPRSPSVDHVISLKELRNYPADARRRLATAPSNMRPAHFSCNASRGARASRRPNAPKKHKITLADVLREGKEMQRNHVAAWYSPGGSPASRNWSGDYIPGKQWFEAHPELFSPTATFEAGAGWEP